MRSYPLILATLGALALAARPAAAQPVEHPSEAPGPPAASASPTGALALGVDLVAAPGELDGEGVRAAIASELGVTLTDEAAFAPALGRLTITIDQANVRIAYQPAAGTLVERTLALPPAPSDRAQLIAFVATNLVRDQAAEILAGLPPAPLPIVVPPARAELLVLPVPPPHHLIATIGFVPPLAVDRAIGAHVVVGVGVHALVGATDGSRIVSVSGLYDAQAVFASGVQIGGLAASAGRLEDGLQLAGVGAYSQTTARGIQVGGVGAAARGDVTGVQVGGVATAAGGSVRGGQLAGVVAVAGGEVRGVQIGGVASVADRVYGLQLAGVANVGGDVEGVQLGVVNVARRMRGVQLGLVNVSEDGNDSYPIGLINYSRNGELAVDGWVESTRLTGVALRHGTRHIHNVWGVAWSPDHGHLLIGGGLGLHHALTRGAAPITLDVDAMSWLTDVWNGHLGQLDQLRATVAVPVGGIELIGGAAANVYISDTMDESSNFHPVIARGYTSDGGTRVVSWPSVFAGIRLRVR